MGNSLNMCNSDASAAQLDRSQRVVLRRKSTEIPKTYEAVRQDVVRREGG
jgi:hypothetical protein